MLRMTREPLVRKNSLHPDLCACANSTFLLLNMSGDASELHVIIFDEIDAICKARGSSSDGTGVHDSIVNQLLTKVS